MQCASLCMNNPDCYLFCVTGEICTLFDAAVTELWQGDYSEDALTFSACFSLTASSLQTFRDNNPDVNSSQRRRQRMKSNKRRRQKMKSKQQRHRDSKS
ncbi:uncharacterized protein LOC119578580 isoform X3 [Penaeus monodon]|uniref:uncharacterized protein LOC119578580 isoform X3 n=1 Tax=Penaeus monodon TaxID=6687 RepID=UPI0018A7B983|nr:uncharacterized protein LOC119578580 isoform X3 [Penaeus monodon]